MGVQSTFVRLKHALPVGLLFAALPVLAHHSYAAFDGDHTRTLKGTIKSVNWGNPHVGFNILVRPESGGKPQDWNIETHSPAIMSRYGWTQHTLKYGDRVSVVCNAMLDGSYGCRLHTLTLLDSGQTLETKLSASLKSESK